jgi:hypothetical protein
MKRALLGGVVLITLAAQFCLVLPAWGQEVTASIVGTVTDPSGAPINGAAVKATSVEQGTAFATKTNETGSYSITRIPVGSYTLEITAQGFQRTVYPPFTLVLNQAARVDAKMKVGQVTETVEVTGAAPVLKTETTEVDTIIDSRTNDNLPLATRNPVQLTLLAPGSLTVDAASLNQGSNTAENGGRPYINGNREQANNFLLDGMDNNQISENKLGLTPSPDAIQEFNLITQNASAEFGNFEGGIVNTTIKSGTNSFHGNAFEFFRNDIFNANTWRNGNTAGTPTGVLPKPKLRWNMFGGTFGGPIIKSKLFFFADYQGGRLDFPPSGATVETLTPAEIGGNFSALLGLPTPVQLLNPCAPGTGTVGGSPCQLVPAGSRVPFAGNIIPSNMLNPAFTKLVTSSDYPQNATPDSNGFGIAPNDFGQQFNSDQGDIKVDYSITGNDRMFGRYSQGYQHDPRVNSFGLLGSTANVAHLKNGVLDWSHTFSPSLLNDARFGINWVSFSDNSYTFPKSVNTLASQLGIAGVTSAGLNLFGFGGGTITQPGAGTLTNLGNAEAIENFASTAIQFNDNIVYSHGKHVIKAGFQWSKYRINVFYAGNGGALGQILFNGQYSAPGTAGAEANAAAAADFALGLPFLVGRGVSGSGGGWHQMDSLFAGYVQDNWRILSTLTLNLGLRYEARTPWVEKDNRQVNINKFTGELEYPGNATVVGVGKNGFSRGLYNSTYGGPDFQPRIGFAWSPSRWGGKTVVRGAYTISSYLEGTGTNLRLTQNPPNTPPQSEKDNVTSTGTPYTTEAGPAAGAVVGGDPFINATVFAWDTTVQPAIAQQWNLTVQREVATNTTLQVGYVGQHGTHLMVPEWLTQGVLQPNGTVSPTPYLGGPNPAGGFGPNQFGVVKLTASVGRMSYNALQAVLQKRYSHGLETQVSYTYSKCMTDNSGYFGTWSNTTQAAPASPYYQNLYNNRADWAQCYWDAKHVLSAYAVYELPFGRGKQMVHDASKAVNAIVGNWTVSPIISWRSGFPIAMYGTDESRTGSAGPRPNCNPSLLHYPKTVSDAGLQWYNTSGFLTDPATGTFGNCPTQGPVIGPRYADVDLGLQKNFPLSERMKLQFRADFLNMFNHPNFSVPGGNGVITATQDPREVQFALKFYF